MSSYSARVAQDSPVLYFENNASGVNNTGSRTPTITTGASNVFYSTGGVANGPYIYVGNDNNSAYGFEYSDSTTTFNDKAFTITGWFKVAATDNQQFINYIFHTGTAANGIAIDCSSSGAVIYASPNGFTNQVTSGNLSLNTWHHVAWTVDSTDMKLYIDGSLVDTDSTPSTISMDSQVKYWMKATTSGTPRYGAEGNFDEWAVFDSTLSSTTIAEHYAAGFAVDYAATPATASALSVDVTLSLTGGYAAEVATASALFASAVQSALDDPTILNEYMATLSLEQWYKFDTDGSIVNYGTGGDPAFALTGIAKTKPTEGLQGIGALEISGKYPDGQASSFQLATRDPEVTDQDFTMGLWVKLPTAYQSISAGIFGVQNPTASSYIGINVGNGYPIFDFRTNQNYSINSTTNIADNQWHFLAVKMTPPGGGNGTAYLYVDGVQAATTSYNGNFDTFNAVTFSNNSGTTSERLLISQAFIAPSSMSTTVLENIYEYGTNSTVQAGARMIDPRLSFNNAYNNLNESLGAIFDYRFDEGTNAIVNYGTYGTLTITSSGTTPEYLKPTKNRFGKKILSTNTNWGQGWTAPAGTFSTTDQQTLVAHIKVDDKSSTVTRVLFSSGIFGSTYGSGMMFLQATTTGYLRFRMNNGSTNYVLNTTYDIADSKWHHVVGVVNGSSVKVYVDGKEIASGTTSIGLSDEGIVWAGGETTLFGAATEAKSVTYDELQIFASAFSAQQVFEHYQSMTIDPTDAVTSLMVNPAYSAGFGPTINETPATSAASMGPVFPPIASMSSEAMFLNPNYEATDVVTIASDVFTASALFEDVTFDIGENNGAQHMDASATFPDARVLIPGKWNANPAIANPALMVEPALSTTLGALIKPQSLNAKGMFSTPPAYILLSDDKWFERLLEQNGDRAIEPVQTNLTNLPNEQSQDVIKGGFLAFFNSLALNITTTSIPNSIENQIPNYYFTKQDEYQYDSEGNILDVDTSKNIARSGAGRSSTTPTPLLSVGTYDNRERKAVKINNIEFSLPGTNRNYSNRYYNMEFSFKTTKTDQVISHGFYTSPTSLTRRIGVVGLSDGKIYLATDNFDPASFTFSAGISGSVTAPHPKKNAKEYLIGKTNVADGEWHHIIIQYGYEDGRTQIWVDSKLERQYNVRPEDGGVTQTNVIGFNGTNTIRPYIIGFNSSEEILRSEFETSGWNFSPGRFISSQDVLLNYAAYDKYEPIKAEPIEISAKMTEDNNGLGNKKKALLLYWWPESAQIYNTDPQIFDTSLTTVDNPNSAPQEYEGWDVFPLSVTGRHGLSDILNKSVAKTNAGYINLETGAPRMLDVINDVDIDQFDAIFFKNYPETSKDVDEYIRNEYVDKYFGLTEKDLYEQFLISLRAAIDTGVSLYVTSKQLALDLKIVKTFNFIPVFDDRFKDTALSIEKPEYIGNDLRSIELANPSNWNDTTNSIKPTIDLRSQYPVNELNTQYWADRNNNMRHRVLNQIEYLTDDSTYIFTDRAYYQNDDNIDFLGANRHYQRFEYRLNGLQVGDEFVFGNPSFKTALGNSRNNQSKGFWAVHKNDILAGTPVTGQPLQYYSQNELVDNPYKDYVHSIALQPGITLDGKGLGGKIFVSISEVFWDETLETSIVDLVTDYWIDIAYENGVLGPVGSSRAIGTRERYKSTSQYISEDGKTSEKYDYLTYWSRNDDYAFVQTDQGDEYANTIGLLFDDVEKVGKVPSVRNSLPSSARARDRLGRFASGSGGAGGGTLWFKAVIGRFTPTMNVYAPNLLTRGFWWLSDRIRLNGLVIRTTPMTASSSFSNANAVPDKDVTISSQSMVSSATFGNPSNYSFAAIRVVVLPMYASAEIVKPGKQVISTPMSAVGQFKNPGVATTGEEEVILIIDNKIAEVYIREDKIK